MVLAVRQTGPSEQWEEGESQEQLWMMDSHGWGREQTGHQAYGWGLGRHLEGQVGD